jgi:hypothetical protein
MRARACLSPPQSHPVPDAALNADISILGKKGRGKTDQGNIARLERGRTQATIRMLQRIAAATGHSLLVEFRPLPKNGK